MLDVHLELFNLWYEYNAQEVIDVMPIDDLIEIMETAINYAINFDPLTPPYEINKRVTVDQFNTKMDNSKFVTGKRLDYDFNVDDI